MEGKLIYYRSSSRVVVTRALAQSFTAICLNIHKCFMHPKMPCTRDMASH